MTGPIGRRRFVTIAAAASGLALAPWPAGLARAAAPDQLHHWRGIVLGADARILLHHPDRATAQTLIAACRDEIARLERIFSLYRPESALCRLNDAGAIDAPPLDLVRLLAESHRISRLTGGAFDVTVQPLWRLYAEHFSASGADPAGPDKAALEQARALVAHGAIALDTARIEFLLPGMAVTLNGIAQGYITDRVAELLRANGIGQVVVDLGEVRALGRHPDGRPWQIGLVDPRAPDALARTVAIENRAVATSGAYGMRFDESGRHHHLFDPRTGRSADHYLSVSVIASNATTADALSTALSAMPLARAAAAIAAAGSATALFTLKDGSVVSQGG